MSMVNVIYLAYIMNKSLFLDCDCQTTDFPTHKCFWGALKGVAIFRQHQAIWYCYVLVNAIDLHGFGISWH